MKKLVRENKFLHQVFLYIFLLGLYSSLVNFADGKFEKKNLSGEPGYISFISFESPHYPVNGQSILTESYGAYIQFVKDLSNSLSIHSVTARLITERKILGLITRSEVILVYPQIFDLLFPFHYYS